MNRGNWFLLFSAAFATFLFSVDSSVVNLTIPVLARYFNVGTSEISFVATAFLVTVSSALLLSAQVMKKFDFKAIFLAAHILFLLATAACGLAQDISLLIVFRVLQGAGASVLVVGGFNAVPRFLPEKSMGLGLGVISASLAFGMVIGYPLGGLISGTLPWRYVFLLQLPLIVLSAIMAWKAFPAKKEARKDHSFDPLGGILLFLMFAALTFATSMGENIGWLSGLILSCFGLSLIFLFLFVQRELRTTSPCLDWTLFRSRAYSLVMSGRLLVGMLQYGNLFLLPFYLKYSRHMAQNEIGLLFLAYAVSYILLAPISGTLADRFHPTKVSVCALFLLILSTIVFLVMSGSPGNLWIGAYLALVSAGFALFYPANNKYVIILASREHRDASVGIFTTVWIGGQSLGVTLFELVFSTSLFLSVHAEHSLAGQFEKIDPTILLTGFRHAYGAGAAAITGALVLIVSGFVAKTREEKGSQYGLGLNTATSLR